MLEGREDEGVVAEHEGAAVSDRVKLGVAAICAFAYVAVSAWFWLGFQNQSIKSPDGRYYASIYTHAPFLAPFWRTMTVQIPSYGDLNSHEVFRLTGVCGTVTAYWTDTSHLEVACHHCSSARIGQEQVDSIHVSLIRK